MKNRIAEMRNEKGLTLVELANLVKVSDGTISRYETNKREPKLDTWQKLADALEVSVPYLQGLTDDKRTPEEIEREYAKTNELVGDAFNKLDLDSERAKGALDSARLMLHRYEQTKNEAALTAAAKLIDQIAVTPNFDRPHEKPAMREKHYDELKRNLDAFIAIAESQAQKDD